MNVDKDNELGREKKIYIKSTDIHTHTRTRSQKNNKKRREESTKHVERK